MLDASENDEAKNSFKLIIYKNVEITSSNPDIARMVVITASSSEKKDQWVAQIKEAKKSIRNKKVFGVPLLELMEREASIPDHPPIPIFLYKLFNYLYEKAQLEEGLFRIAASIAQIQHLKQEANKGKDVVYEDPHVGAAMLKTFFRELPDILVTQELRPWFLELGGPDAPSNPKSQLDICTILISKIPSPNREVLKTLIGLFNELVNHTDVNKMTPTNLGVVFGPNIFQNSKSESDALEMQYMNKVVSFMISNYPSIFV